LTFSNASFETRSNVAVARAPPPLYWRGTRRNRRRRRRGRKKGRKRRRGWRRRKAIECGSTKANTRIVGEAKQLPFFQSRSSPPSPLLDG
jgi:hypothetical protein